METDFSHSSLQAEGKTRHQDVTVEGKEVPAEPQKYFQKETLQTILQKAEDDPSLKVSSVEVHEGSKQGDNYMSFMHAVVVEATRGIGSQQRPCSYSLMVKALPKNPSRREMLLKLNSFCREVKQYTVTFPAFVTLQRQQGIEDIYQDYPRCLHAYTDGEDDYLVLQNLRPLGFKMADRLGGFDISHARMVMHSIAVFHALGYGISSGDPDRLLEMFPFLEDTVPDNDKMKYEYFLTKSFTKSIEVIEKASEGGEFRRQLEWMNKAKETFQEKLLASLQPKKGRAVITHGDFWVNNMMFRYDESGQPIELKLVDYQFSKVGSRANDLVFFFLSSLVGDVRWKIKDELLQVYQDSFVGCLKSLGLDTSQFTLEELKTELKDRFTFGFALALALLPMITLNPDDVFDMESISKEDFEKGPMESKVMEKMYQGKRYIQRLLEAVNDAMEAMPL